MFSFYTVFGLFNTTFRAKESSVAITLRMGYMSGAPPSSFAGVNLRIDGISASNVLVYLLFHNMIVLQTNLVGGKGKNLNTGLQRCNSKI